MMFSIGPAYIALNKGGRDVEIIAEFKGLYCENFQKVLVFKGPCLCFWHKLVAVFSDQPKGEEK